MLYKISRWLMPVRFLCTLIRKFLVIDEGEMVYRHFVDISIAVATPRGLVVPVMRNVENMDYADIERTLNDLGIKVFAISTFGSI